MSEERPLKRTDVELTEVEDGFVAYDEANGRVHHLNVPVVVVFELASGERSLPEIAEVVATEFELDAPPLDDVTEAIRLLRREGLVS